MRFAFRRLYRNCNFCSVSMQIARSNCSSNPRRNVFHQCFSHVHHSSSILREIAIFSKKSQVPMNLAHIQRTTILLLHFSFLFEIRFIPDFDVISQPGIFDNEERIESAQLDSKLLDIKACLRTTLLQINGGLESEFRHHTLIVLNRDRVPLGDWHSYGSLPIFLTLFFNADQDRDSNTRNQKTTQTVRQYDTCQCRAGNHISRPGHDHHSERCQKGNNQNRVQEQQELRPPGSISRLHFLHVRCNMTIEKWSNIQLSHRAMKRLSLQTPLILCNNTHLWKVVFKHFFCSICNILELHRQRISLWHTTANKRLGHNNTSPREPTH